MASTYNQKKEEEAQRLKQQQSQTSGNAALDGAQQQAASLADATQQQAYTGYMPSVQLQQAQQYVQQVQQQKPGAYQSAITPQLQAQFEAILNRQPFSYDLGTDPIFQQYTDQYVQKGRRAMQDTMGQAAALTGGYGNSYAQGAGQAAYGNYLQELNTLAPQFQQNAFARWQSEGADMMDRYNALAAREENEYGRYQDTVNAYYADLDRAQQAADNAYDREYGQYMDKLNYDQQKAEWEQKVQSENRDYAYNTALMILQGGQMPSSELLAEAGLSDADAKTLMAMYTPKKSSGGSSGSSGQKKQGSTGATTVYVNPTTYEKSGVDTLKEAVTSGAVTVKTTDMDDGVLSQTDWIANREKNDPMYAAKKQTMNPLNLQQKAQEDAEEYKDYVAGVIESDLLSGRISETKAANLVKKYLLD